MEITGHEMGTVGRVS